MRRLLIIWISLLLAALSLRAQPNLLGRVLAKVTCAKDPAQSYALYLPSNYTPQKAWPVIFCFDPGAHGLEPVQRFQAAAEKYGYIVAGSLNSRNGPWADNVAAIQAMVGDIETQLHLDGKRVYTAGLSGGARVATQLALAGMAHGVIACSAGFPQVEGGIPRKISFPFFGTTGTEDFNNRELQRLDEELDARSATHRIVIFDGGHEWAPAELLAEGVLWLELQAMRAGTRPRDEALIQSALAARRAALPAAPAGEVWRATRALADDFQGLVDTAEFEAKVRELAASREVKAWRQAGRDLVSREETLAASLNTAATDSGPEMRRQVAALRALADAAADSPERRMARRVLAGAAMSVREGVRGIIDNGDYDTAVSMLEMGIAIRPEQTRNYFELARACALNGDKSRALKALQQAADKGFSDAPRVEGEAAFAKLRADPAWPVLLAKIRANPAEPAPSSRGRP